MIRHPNFELCDALVRLDDGSFSSVDLIYQQRLDWRNHDLPPMNAQPGRMKFCPYCWTTQPIANFIFEGIARTILRIHADGDLIAHVVENVREWCNDCQARLEAVVAAEVAAEDNR